MSICALYDMWPQYNGRMREVIAEMTDSQAAFRPIGRWLADLGDRRSQCRRSRARPAAD